MGICRKIVIINLHHMQMLFMLWIKYKLSECLAPAQTWRPPVENSLATILPRPADTVRHSEELTPKSFYASQILLCSEKFVLNIWSKQLYFPLKNVSSPQTLKPSYGPDSAKIVSAIRIFCFEGHSASRCSITSKTFFHKSPLGGRLVFYKSPWT